MEPVLTPNESKTEVKERMTKTSKKGLSKDKEEHTASQT